MSKIFLPCKRIVFSKGQVVLPSAIRHRLGIHAGDPLKAEVENNQIVLTPAKPRRHRARIVKDPVTGLPVLSVGANGPILSSRQVEEMLTDFP